MIDELNTIIQIKQPLEVLQQSIEPFMVNDIKFFPQWHPNGFITYNGMIDNLKLNIFNDSLSIKNSWHKFYKGNNYSDYSFTDIKRTYDKLETKLGLSISDAEIKRIGYGCVIKTNPHKVFKSWKYLRNTESKPMYKNGTQYGSFFPFTDYKIKGYDKTFEVWKHNNIRIEPDYFRFEKEVKYMRHLHNRKQPIGIYKTKDLFNKDILIQLSQDLITNYRLIEKTPQMNLKGLNPKQLRVLAVMENNTLRNELKANHNKTYKRDKELYKNLFKGELNTFNDEVETLITDKLNILLNS